MKRLFKRLGPPSPAMVVAIAALVMSSVGGAMAASSIITKSSQVKNGAITGSDIKNRTIKSADVAKGTINSFKGKTGAQGPAGQNGATGTAGPIGPSNAFEAVKGGSNFTTLSGTNDATANTVVSLPNLPAGEYVVIATLGVNTSGTTSSRVVCDGSLGSSTGGGIVQIGNSAGTVGQAPVSMSFTAKLAAPGTATVKCHTESLSGSAPFASEAHIQAIKVGSVTSVAG